MKDALRNGVYRRMKAFLDTECLVLPSTREVTRLIVEDMRKGIEGRPSSLRMIRTFLSKPAPPTGRSRALALDAGGTNLRIALFEAENANLPDMLAFEKKSMPDTGKGIEVGEFFDEMASIVVPFLKKEPGLPIGFTFSYPMEILPDLDARVFGLCKELKVNGIEGAKVAVQLRYALDRAEVTAGPIRIINDSTAVMLAAQSSISSSAIVGFILGTGLNSCYEEQQNNQGPGEIRVLESGAFRFHGRTRLDEAFDALSVDPGSYTYEKMISGAYLGPLVLEVLKAASQFGLYTPSFASTLDRIKELPTCCLVDILSDESRNASQEWLHHASSDDLKVVVWLARFLVSRAARLAAATVAAPIIRRKSCGNKDPNFVVAAEGSTLWGVPGMLDGVKKATREAVDAESAIEFLKVEHGGLFGAAAAAFLGV
jgi:hexokinase